MTNQSIRQCIPTFTQLLQLLNFDTHDGSSHTGNQTPRKIDIDHRTVDASSLLNDTNKIAHIKYDHETTVLCYSYFQQLPNELISLIIHHLDQEPKRRHLYQCSLVSKQFHMLANPLLWQRIRLANDDISQRFIASFVNTLVPEEQLSTLGQHIQQLYIRDNGIWTDGHIQWLLQHIPNLKVLCIISHHKSYDLCGGGLTDMIIQHLHPHYCPQLTSLDVNANLLTVASCQLIAQHCPNLTNLKWTLTYGQSDQMLELILVQCPLTSLEMITPNSSLNEKSQTLIQNIHKLTRLKIHQKSFQHHVATVFTITPPPYTIPEKPTTTTTTSYCYWPQLTLLDLAFIKNVDQPTFIQFIKSHPHLQEIKLSRVMGLSDACLDTMGQWLPNLFSLSLRSDDGGGMETISVGGINRLIYGCLCLISLELYGFETTLLQQHFHGVYYSSFTDKHIRLSRQEIHQIRGSKQQQ